MVSLAVSFPIPVSLSLSRFMSPGGRIGGTFFFADMGGDKCIGGIVDNLDDGLDNH